MHLLTQTLILGLVTGLVYSLTGAGLVAVYRTSRIINFAQGSIGTVGLFAAYPLTQSGHPYWVVALVTLAVTAATGVAVGCVVNFVASKNDELIGGLAAIAVSLVIDGALTITAGGNARSFPSLGTTKLFSIGSVALNASDVGVAVAAVLAFGILGVIFTRTTAGLGMRAISENPSAAQVIGVRTTLLRLSSWFIGGVLAGIAALFLAPLFSLTPTSIEGEIVFGFAAVVIGGFDSIAGALVAGIALGIVSNAIGVYLDLNLVTTGLFLLMVVLLLVRPFGLFGRRPLERV